MKRYRVRLSADAEQGRIDIYCYVASHETVEPVDARLDGRRDIPSLPERRLVR